MPLGLEKKRAMIIQKSAPIAVALGICGEAGVKRKERGKRRKGKAARGEGRGRRGKAKGDKMHPNSIFFF